MTEGIDTFLNQGVPLKGESEIKQQKAAYDILTITGAVGQTGDFLVLQNSAGTRSPSRVHAKQARITESTLKRYPDFGW